MGFELRLSHQFFFLHHLRGKCYGKFLARYLKMDVGGGAETLKYIKCITNMMLCNLLNFVDFDGLDI